MSNQSNSSDRMLQKGDFARLGLPELTNRHPIKSRAGRKVRIMVDRTGVREVKAKTDDGDE